jgi:hypothetical protein
MAKVETIDKTLELYRVDDITISFNVDRSFSCSVHGVSRVNGYPEWPCRHAKALIDGGYVSPS